jgi:hypothetical protein
MVNAMVTGLVLSSQALLLIMTGIVNAYLTSKLNKKNNTPLRRYAKQGSGF